MSSEQSLVGSAKAYLQTIRDAWRLTNDILARQGDSTDPILPGGWPGWHSDTAHSVPALTPKVTFKEQANGPFTFPSPFYRYANAPTHSTAKEPRPKVQEPPRALPRSSFSTPIALAVADKSRKRPFDDSDDVQDGYIPGSPGRKSQSSNDALPQVKVAGSSLIRLTPKMMAASVRAQSHSPLTPHRRIVKPRTPSSSIHRRPTPLLLASSPPSSPFPSRTSFGGSSLAKHQLLSTPNRPSPHSPYMTSARPTSPRRSDVRIKQESFATPYPAAQPSQPAYLPTATPETRRPRDPLDQQIQRIAEQIGPTMTPHTPAVARAQVVITIDDETELEYLLRQHALKCQTELKRQRESRRRLREEEESKVLDQLHAIASFLNALGGTFADVPTGDVQSLKRNVAQQLARRPQERRSTEDHFALPKRTPEQAAADLAKERAFLKSLRERLSETIETPFYDEIFLHAKSLDEVIDQLHHQITFPPVPERGLEQVHDALDPRSGRASDLLADLRAQPVNRSDMRTMRDRCMLNDEVINHYMQLIIVRAEEMPDKYPSVHAFNTFFFGKLKKEGYNAVRRWTKKTDIFAKDYVLVPIHLSLHWTMAVINMKDRVIEYYDSLHGHEPDAFRTLLDYLQKEHENKKPPSSLDIKAWTTFYAHDCPMQHNGYDCGVFSCQFGEYRSRGDKALAFDQSNMLYFREKMVWEMLSGRLLL